MKFTELKIFFQCLDYKEVLSLKDVILKVQRSNTNIAA